MTAPAERVYIYGRIRGVTRRWLQSLSAAAGVTLTRGTMTADTIVLGHNMASRAVSHAGELRLDFRRKPSARLVSERRFRSRLGLKAAPASNCQYSEDQVVKHTGLNGAQLGTLALFDVLGPSRRPIFLCGPGHGSGGWAALFVRRRVSQNHRRCARAGTARRTAIQRSSGRSPLGRGAEGAGGDAGGDRRPVPVAA